MNLLEERQGFVQAAGLPVGQCEVVHGTDGGEVVAVGLRLAEPEFLLEQRDRLGDPAGVAVGRGEMVQGVEGIGVIGTAGPRQGVAGLRQQLQRLAVPSQVADRVAGHGQGGPRLGRIRTGASPLEFGDGPPVLLAPIEDAQAVGR